jgi:hypothetical protein
MRNPQAALPWFMGSLHAAAWGVLRDDVNTRQASYSFYVMRTVANLYWCIERAGFSEICEFHSV